MIAYLLKTILCSSLLLVVYLLLLQKEKMLRFNRFYLLFSLLFSFVVPLISLSVSTESLQQSSIITVLPNADVFINITPENTPIIAVSPVETAAFNWWYLVAFIYTAGCLVMLFRFGKNLLQIQTAICKNNVRHFDNARLVLLDKLTVPHSFFRYIFLNKEAYENDLVKPEILCHELTHTDQKHSFDIVLIELLIAFCWFNPILYFYRQAIRLNHEFLADEAVIKSFDDAPTYQHLLLQTATVSTQPFPASSFNYSITKKRFLMMTKNTSLKVVIVKGTIIFSLFAAAVLVFSTRTTAQAKEPLQNAKKDISSPKEKASQDQQDKDGKNLRASPWISLSIGYTKEGTTPEQLQEYQAIITKYKTDGKWWMTFSNRISETDRSRMETIFKQMSFTQQGEQFVLFTKRSGPLPKTTPSVAQFEAFKNPKLYGLWIDGKHVSNTELNKYTNTDFSQFMISKLYGAAKTGRSYIHQLDMMTNAYYQTYYNRTISNTKSNISFAMNNHPTDSIRQKFRDHYASQTAANNFKYSNYKNKSLFKTIPLGKGVSEMVMDQYQNTLKRVLDQKGTNATKTQNNSEVLINRLALIYWEMNDRQRKQIIKGTELLIASL